MDLYNYTPIVFDDLYNTIIHTEILNTLSTYNLIIDNVINFKNRDVSNIVTYFTLYFTIKKIKENIEKQNVVIVNPYIVNKIDDNLIYEHEILKKMIKKVLKIIEKSYPCKIIFFKSVYDVDNNDSILMLFNHINKFKNINNKQLSELINIKNLRL